MITDKKHAALTAAHLAMSMGDNDQLATEMLTTLFDDGNRDDAVFELVQQYRFTGESLYLHHCGLGIYGDDTAPWLSTPDDFRLALTLYCANVPILAAFIPPEVKQEARPAPDPRRGFDSINDDEDNRGTIYDRETLRAAESQTETAGAPTPGADQQESGSPGVPPAAAGQTATDHAHGHQGGLHAGQGSVAPDNPDGNAGTNAALVAQNTDREAELGEDPAAAAEALPDKPIIPASAQDDGEDPHSGGDVVDDDAPTPFDDDDDDGDDDDGIVGDEPPPPPAKGKKKKA